MTRLEWCRANAPDTYADYSDEDLLRAMFESSKEFEDEFEPDEKEQDNAELRPINNYLDEMVHVLVSVFDSSNLENTRCNFVACVLEILLFVKLSLESPALTSKCLTA